MAAVGGGADENRKGGGGDEVRWRGAGDEDRNADGRVVGLVRGQSPLLLFFGGRHVEDLACFVYRVLNSNKFVWGTLLALGRIVLALAGPSAPSPCVRRVTSIAQHIGVFAMGRNGGLP